MTVTIKLFASLRAGRFDARSLTLPAPVRVSDAIAAAKVPCREAAVILVNSRHAALDHSLADGDTLALFPLVGGG